MTDDSDIPFRTALQQACAAIGVLLSLEQIDTLEAHFRLMIEANRRFNLTRITEPVEAAVKHYADALSVVAWSRERGATIRTVLDVGTGAGLPAVALAAVQPQWQITAIDGNAKKAGFVADCADALQLRNLAARQKHTHHWRDGPGRFDLVTFRAVGKLAACITQARPFLGPGGTVVCYKSQQIPDQEVADGHAAAKRAGLAHQDSWPYAMQLGHTDLRRLLIGYRKA